MKDYRARVRLFAGIILVVLGVLGLRLAYLQLFEYDAYYEVARTNAIRQLRVLPARGAFIDRDGLLLAGNAPTYTVTITPRYFDERRVGLLAGLLEVPDSLVRARLEEARRWSPFRPSRSFREVPIEAFSRLQEHLYELPGVNFEVGQRRYYPTAVQAAHAFGFILFAPYDDPRIALAIMVENAGYGSVAAGPIASLMAEQYLTGRISDTPERRAVLRRALRARSAVPPRVVSGGG